MLLDLGCNAVGQGSKIGNVRPTEEFIVERHIVSNFAGQLNDGEDASSALLAGMSVGTQCHLLSISQSSFYDAPQAETALNLELMLLIDKQFLNTAFYVVRQMTWHLQNEGQSVNEKRIRCLTRVMRVRRENSPQDSFLTPLTVDPSKSQHN